MFEFETLQERTRERRERLEREACAERLARQARGRRFRRRQRFALEAAFGFFRGARGRLQADT
jgi:hypothetical protein